MAYKYNPLPPKFDRVGSGGGGGGDVQTLTGNTGSPVGPDGSGNINIIGSGGGLEGIVVTGTTNTLTISLSEKTYTSTGQTAPGFQDQLLLPVIPIDVHTSMSVRVNVVGRELESGFTIGGEILATFKRITGSVSIVGSVDTTINRDSDLDECTFVAVPSGNDIAIEVFGQNPYTIRWVAIVNVVSKQIIP